LSSSRSGISWYTRAIVRARLVPRGMCTGILGARLAMGWKFLLTMTREGWSAGYDRFEITMRTGYEVKH
jgi:hypothetical protein